ncbi:MAG: sialidase family protein [Patescibacteria group bacterium]|jgi:hypothetical protein
MFKLKPIDVLLALLVAVLFAAAAGLFVFSSRPTVIAPAAPQKEVAGPPPAAEPATAPAAETAAPETPPITIEEAVPPTPEPPPLPRATIGQINSQGLRPITVAPAIGDVGRIYFHAPSRSLLMAVVEFDGWRSIYKMSVDDGTVRRVLNENQRPGDIFLDGDSRGNLYAHFDLPGDLYRSADVGENWDLVSKEIGGTFWTIADDRNGTIYGTQHAYNQAVLYRSTDDGLTWSPWIDFQQLYPKDAVTYAAGDDRFRLRHLHAVFWHDGDLYVGTGDVARYTLVSKDAGKTWRQIWDEGFTAATIMKDNAGILFGPDRLQAHGIAMYDVAADKLREVWSPVTYGYAGYTYSLLTWNGVYYAAFHTEANEVASFAGKFGIIVSLNGRDWYKFLEFGPLTHWARSDIFLTPGRDGVYISLNGSLYLTDALDKQWFEFRKPFGQ